MAKMPRTTPQPKKLVWRISATAPQGEWVDPSQPAAAPPKLAEPEVSTGSWVTSSFDLLSGTDVERARIRYRRICSRRCSAPPARRQSVAS